MVFATDGERTGRIALIVSEQTLQRLAPGLKALVGPGRDYGMIRLGEEPARILEQLQEWRPAGVIMEFREELTELIAGMGFPTVVVMADMLVEGMGCVNVDDYKIGMLAAEYLWGKGLRKFGYYGLETYHAPERRTGFVECLGNKGVEVSVKEITGGERETTRRKTLDAWLEQLEQPAGIFAAHDPLGRDVLESCLHLGLQVPSDTAILSASDDQVTCELVHPGISSVDIPWEQVGITAGQLLERMLEGEPPGDPVIVSPSGIRTRGSTDYYRVSDIRIQRAIDFMRGHLSRDIDVPAVVRAVGMDRRALERLFRAQLNRSPRQVLTDMRIDRARELLEFEDLRIGEVAEKCGFGTSEKMATAFRKRFRKTPREWRKAACGGR